MANIWDMLFGSAITANKVLASPNGSSGVSTFRSLVAADLPAGTGTVTSVAETFTGGIISVGGSPITTSGTLALTVAGTSGGIPYFSGTTTWASSALLAANGIVIGGGSGTAPFTSTTTLTALGDLQFNTAGNIIKSGTSTAIAFTLNSNNVTVGSLTINSGNLIIPAGNYYEWNGRSVFSSPSDGTIKLENNSASGGFTSLQLGNQTAIGSLLTKYNSIATVSNGVPAEYATVDLTAQSAAIGATTLYAVPAAGQGMYRISWCAAVTTAASTSSILGGTNGLQITYTDPADSAVKTSPRTVTSGVDTDSTNTTSTAISGTIIVFAKLSTNIQYAFDYTSVGVTAMQFSLHLKCEAL